MGAFSRFLTASVGRGSFGSVDGRRDYPRDELDELGLEGVAEGTSTSPVALARTVSPSFSQRFSLTLTVSPSLVSSYLFFLSLLLRRIVFFGWQSRCIIRCFVGVGVMRYAYHLTQILRAQAARSQVFSPVSSWSVCSWS